jgi:hypothetical protein
VHAAVEQHGDQGDGDDALHRLRRDVAPGGHQVGRDRGADEEHGGRRDAGSLGEPIAEHGEAQDGGHDGDDRRK